MLKRRTTEGRRSVKQIQTKTPSNNSVVFIQQANVLYFLLASQLFVLAPLFLYLDFWISGICLCGIIWRFAEEKWQFPEVNKWLRALLVILAAVFLFKSQGGFTGREPGIALAALMFGFKSIELKQNRDALLVILLGYFLVLCSFLFNQSVWIAVYALVALLLLTSTLHACYAAKFGSEVKQVVKTSGWIIAQAIPLGVFLFLFFPRISSPLWNMPTKGQAGTGVSESMTPGSISNLMQDNSVAFRVEFADKIPESTDFYWRAFVLDHYQDNGWTRNQRFPVHSSQLGNFSDPIEYEITLEGHNNTWLFQLEQSQVIGVPAIPMDDLSWQMANRLNRVIRYQGKAFMSYQFDPNLSDQQYAINTQINPEQNQRMQRFSRQLWSQSADKMDFINKVRNIINKQEFHYTLQPPRLRGDMIDDFWFNTRKGFCEHYAGAFVYLMRSAGIPARVVVGYQGGEQNPYDDYWIVRQSSAHAWTEVWFEGEGWKRFDPTSWIHPSRVELDFAGDILQRNRPVFDFGRLTEEQLTMLKQLSLYWDTFNQGWNDVFLNYNAERQVDVYRWFNLAHNNLQQIIIVMVSGVCLMVGLWLLMLIKRKPQLNPWQRWFIKLVGKMPIEDKSELVKQSPDIIFKQAMKCFPQKKRLLQQLEARYNTIRFGRVASKEDVPELFTLALKQLPKKSKSR